MVVVPIMSDAEIDLPGRILRFEVPRRRQAFDFDLKQMRLLAKEKLEKFQAEALQNPGPQTDLLRTLKAASEESAAVPKGHRVAIVCLSDFLQDDRQYNFKIDRRLDRPDHARQFADDLSQEIGTSLDGVTVYLGHLGSKDLRRLDSQRRQAIASFWTEYMSKMKARVIVAMDGPGSLPQFLESIESD